MVKRKTNQGLKLLKMTLIMLAVFCVLLGFTSIIFLLVAVALGVGVYFTSLHTEIEYEYLYVDRQLTVDKILNQNRRKRVAVYDLDRMEILAPFSSHRLDSYKNREAKTFDFSSGLESKPDPRFTMYMSGNNKIILEPTPEMVKAISTVAPRKVFKE
jgi:hypothetical protein